MDPITYIFKTMHVKAIVPYRLEATAPWGLRHSPREADGQPTQSIADKISPYEVAHFAMILRGNCWLSVDGITDPIPLSSGDCFLLAPGNAYTLRDNPRTRARSCYEAARPDSHNVIRCGGGGTPASVISGMLCFDKPNLKPVSEFLPALILVKAEQARSVALHTTLELLAGEMAEQAPGSEVVANRLAEILFIQTFRAHIALSGEECKPGWFRAIFDPQIGAALKAIHKNVNKPWTVESLAAAAGMSRSAFAARFKDLVGQTPLDYITEGRMQKAIQFLQQQDKKLAEIAQYIGYESDTAFSKAFKRVLGMTPGEYRRNGIESYRHDMALSFRQLHYR